MSTVTTSAIFGESTTKESQGSLFGLCAVSASTLIVEIVLTKFLSFKLFHHMAFVVLSLVILSLGAAGILTYTNPTFFGFNKERDWSRIASYAVLYAIAISLIIPLFAWLPLTPYDKDLSILLRFLSMPLIFVMLSVPFFFAGICICQTLVKSQHPVTIIYFWDLFAAAVGAILSPILLPILGGYGTIAFAAVLALIGAIAYWKCDGSLKRMHLLWLLMAVVAIFSCLFYPVWSMQKYGIDILTFKENGPKTVLRDFGGIAKTHWNAIARVDLSYTGTSHEAPFRYGLSPITDKDNIVGRYIMLDGGANTRQFKAQGDLHTQTFLENSLWASPYIIKPHTQTALVIGGGGGIDILVGKFFKIPQLTVVEMNPAVFALLNGRDDADDAYTRWLKSDAYTKVSLIYDEARHYATILKPETFDVMQASGVDTLTAIQTGGMSLTENYLYTVEAVRDYMRLLKPDGILSLTHWRDHLSGTSMRMFTTYLAYLDAIHVKNPASHLVVLGTEDWTDSLLKGTPFTSNELERIRQFAKQAQLSVIFDPERKSTDFKPRRYEGWYNKLAFADPQTRQQLIKNNLDIPAAVHDDKPYFYSFQSSNSSQWVQLNQSNVSLSLIMITMMIGLFLIVLPFFKLNAHELVTPVYWLILYFSACGFAFLLYETAIIQLFNIFVGGPTYAMSVVLVSVLAGYGLGSGIAAKLPLRMNTFIHFGVGLGSLFLILYWLIPILTHILLPLTLPLRLLASGLITLISSAAIGGAVATAMSVVRNHYGAMVSWMWGVGSVANALGSICFVAITQAIGISSCLLIVAALYLIANLMFAMKIKTQA